MRPRIQIWLAVYLFIVGIPLLGLAIHYRWFAEDAFISARYARNLIEGNGLVFNRGERVEGYTNFLWTLLLASGLRLGFPVQSTGIALGLIFTSSSFVFLFAIHRKLFPAARPFFPVTILAVGLNYTWACFSTSGLETSLLCCLMIGSAHLLLCVETDQDHPAIFFCLGILSTLLMLTRPDTVLFIGLIFLYLIFFRITENRRKELVLFLSPLFFVAIPYALWKISYYRSLMPNTFYAKSGDLSYYSQGLRYIWRFAQNYTLWAWIPVFLYFVIQRDRTQLRDRVVLLLLLYCLIHVTWVIRVGGDFMDGRYLVVLLPFLYLCLEFAIQKAPVRKRLQHIAFMCIVVSSAVYRPVPREYRANITDERTWTHSFELWYQEGQVFRKYLPSSTIVATDGVGAFGYSSRLPIVDTLGLTDLYVARLPLAKRGPPGHEKLAPMDYLERRRVDILRDGMQQSIEKPVQGSFSGYRYYLLSEKPELKRVFPLILKELEALENLERTGPLAAGTMQRDPKVNASRAH